MFTLGKYLGNNVAVFGVVVTLFCPASTEPKPIAHQMLTTLLLALAFSGTPTLHTSQLPDHVSPSLYFSDVATYDPVWLHEQHLGDGFRVLPGSSLTPTSVVWWGADYKATFTGPDSFNLAIYEDDGLGTLGTLQWFSNGVQPLAAATGFVPSGVAYPWIEKRYEVNITGAPNLTEGLYHIVIYADTTFSSDGTWGWASLPTDPASTTPGFVFTADGGGNWIASPSPEFAFELYGNETKPLSADVAGISLNTGGDQNFALSAGAAHAGDLYLMLGSFAGTSPGLDYGAFNIPLNVDAYFAYSLTSPGSPLFTGFFGTLDASGTASAALKIPGGVDPALVGIVGNHAFLTIDLLTAAATFVSNSVSVDLLP